MTWGLVNRWKTSQPCVNPLSTSRVPQSVLFPNRRAVIFLSCGRAGVPVVPGLWEGDSVSPNCARFATGCHHPLTAEYIILRHLLRLLFINYNYCLQYKYYFEWCKPPHVMRINSLDCYWLTFTELFAIRQTRLFGNLIPRVLRTMLVR